MGTGVGWNAASKTEYESAAMLLREVWYAEDHLDDEHRTVEWEPILAPGFGPSDGEVSLVGIAQMLWTGTGPRLTGGFMGGLSRLDEQHQDLVLKALAVRLGRTDG